MKDDEILIKICKLNMVQDCANIDGSPWKRNSNHLKDSHLKDGKLIK